jgi:hypothetical protein
LQYRVLLQHRAAMSNIFSKTYSSQVLVGAFAGARFGRLAIAEQHLAHCRPGVVARAEQAALALWSTPVGGHDEATATAGGGE